jgi:hypothetical protein
MTLERANLMSFRKSAVVIAAVLALASVPASVHAQQKTDIRFAAGNDNAAVEGTIKGSAYHDYALGAKAGQRMSVSLITKGSAFFNILPPGSNDVAIYNSSINGNDATGMNLPSDGNYTIRVYLMGDAKDSGKTVSYMVSTTIMN